MLTIYTHSKNVLRLEFWRWAMRAVVHKYSGPDAVRDSLIRGLSGHRISYRINVPPGNGDSAVVLSGTQALQDAIRWRRAGRIKKLIAGPNVVMHPNDSSGVMLDDAIDTILTPSDWVKDFWHHEAPLIAPKLHVWAAGTAIASGSTRTGLPLIYDKFGDETLYAKISATVGAHRLFTYGTFTHSAYLAALADAPYLVYLARSESQGLALQEAWAHDVPTLVNHSTHWNGANHSWDAPHINCPYLTAELGMVFEDTEELRTLTPQTTLLHPKGYCDAHLSDYASTEALLKLL